MAGTTALKVMHISMAKVYSFKAVTFEFHDFHGVTFRRRKTRGVRDHRNVGSRGYAVFLKWLKLPELEREKYLV